MKYLKEHWLPIMVIILLLVIQAACELALPAYTSDIVDVGIQQGGIIDRVPSVIRGSQLETMKYFLLPEDIEVIEASYKPILQSEISEGKWKNYVSEYPLLESEPLYELVEIEKETQNELEKVLSLPMIILQGSKMETTESTSENSMMSGVSSPEDMKKMLEELPESIEEQMVSAYIKGEYEMIGIDLGSIQSSYIWRAGVRMIGIALIAMLTTIVVGLFASRIGAKVGMKLRNRVFEKVVSFSNTELDQFSTASLITRSTNDIQQIQMVTVLVLRMILYAPVLGIGGIIKVLNTNTSMTWIIFIGVVANLCVVGVLMMVSMPKFKAMQELVDRLNLVTREILTGLPVIRAFSRDKQEEKRFDIANKDLTKTMLFTNRTMTFMMPFMMLIMNGITLLIIWFGAQGINQGQLQVGDMMAFITYTVQIVMSFLMLSMIAIILPRAAVSANRVDEILTTELIIKDPENPQVRKSKGQGVIEFDHVSFAYPSAEENVLEDITFTAKPGETTAIIGSTGCGKSTLINLIPRLYDVSKGSIRIDGVDVREYATKDLRDYIGFVPQKGVLFSGTIDSNLRFGNQEATTEEIQKAARIAQATGFIEENTEKYESNIAQGGNNVSGGQKQRLSIARAIAKKPQIYIFDDSFSALDYKTDIALRKALHEETADSTVLIVAQRISTIMQAEQIIVLDDGKIAGTGTHKELLKNNPVYQQIAYSQLSKEELEGGKDHE